MFANGPGDQGSIPGWVIPKTQKMVLDSSLLNTYHYKVRIKSKVELSREWSSALPYTFRLPSTKVVNFTYYFSPKQNISYLICVSTLTYSWHNNAIEANLMNSAYRVSGKLRISLSSVVHRLQKASKANKLYLGLLKYCKTFDSP